MVGKGWARGADEEREMVKIRTAVQPAAKLDPVLGQLSRTWGEM